MIIHSNTRMFPNTTSTKRPLGYNFSPLELPHTPSAYSEETSSSNGGHGGNYRAVAMTPLIVPGSGGDSPLFTWGDICGTPLNLDPNSTSTISVENPSSTTRPSWLQGVITDRDSRFEILPSSRRETVARDMVVGIQNKKSKKSDTRRVSSSKTPLSAAASLLSARLTPAGPNVTPFGGGMSYGTGRTNSRTRRR